MYSKERCTVCGTAMELADQQPIGDLYEVLFFKCPLCSKSTQIVTCSKTVLIAPE
jgi:hypothetical protein